jgi:hypothetical protein
MTARRLSTALLIVGVLATVSLSKDAVMNVSNVTIVWMDPHSLVVSRHTKGRTEEVRFVLTSDTVCKGNLHVGSRVTVHYMIQNHENIATSVQARDQASK